MKINTIFFFVIGASILFVGVAYYMLSTPSKPQTQILSYNSQDKEKPKAELGETSQDIGKIKVSDKKEVDFVIKNSGNKNLQLSQITSSCGCTSGKILYNGKESKEYSMHAQSDDVFEIAPNTQATLRLTYRPFTMPVYGALTREVYVTTNDPSNPKLVFQIKTFVE